MSRSRPILLATLALMLALGMGLSPRGAVASSGADEARDAETITTVLYPGWNLVGWVGPDTPTSELFDAIPALRQVWAWDAESQAYQHALRNRGGNLPTLTLGMGVWLRLGGKSAYSWRRPASDQGVVLDLHRGQNLLGWIGEDGAGLADTLARFGDDLLEVWHWDAKAQRYVPYPPGSDAASLATLARGQALRIELARDTRWWGRGTARPTFVFADDITAEQREEVKALFESATDVIARRFGVHTTDYTVNVPAGNAFYCSVLHNVVEFQFPGCRAAAVAHEYFHVVQNVLSVEPHEPYFAPDWMNEGTADYAQHVYDRETGARGRNPRFAVEQLTRTPGEVHDFDRRRRYLPYALGFIAAEWLADHAGEESLAEFYRLGRSHDRWQDAFRPAFGIEVDDFYQAVEVYRHERAPIYPHLLDDRTEVVVVPLSEAAVSVAADIRAEITNLTDFSRERFGADTQDYTVYVVDAKAFPSSFVSAFGDLTYCAYPPGNSVIIIFDCDVPDYYWAYSPDGDHYTRYINDHHINHILYDLAPPLSTLHLVRTDIGVSCPWGIYWLCNGVPQYIAAMYEVHTGAADLNHILERKMLVAHGATKSLSSFEGSLSAGRANAEAESAVLFLAAHRLAHHAGEKALLEYFRLLPSAETIYEAFEGAFGLTLDEFYTQFEAYREMHPYAPPHATDDTVGPVLTFQGALPADYAGETRPKFEAFQAFFEDRFGAERQELTVHVLINNREVEQEIPFWRGIIRSGSARCVNAWDDITVISIDRCGHFGSIDGFYVGGVIVRNRGPWWLQMGLNAYATAAYQAHKGVIDLDTHRDTQIYRALETSGSLRGMENSAGELGAWYGAALGFVATDWLAGHAGEHALASYYQHLPLPEYTTDRGFIGPWRAAFEEAFGLTPDEFYEQFEAYWATLAAE